MILRGIIDEDIVNYHKTSMYLAFPNCSFKCEKECGKPICQNAALAKSLAIDIAPEVICERYVNNPITSAIVLAGLEPFDSRFEMLVLIDCLRRLYNCDDDIVIYTGYTEEEIMNDNEHHLTFANITEYPNIIIKYGRFIPNQESHFDEILGVNLASPNQYAKKVS